MGIPAGITLIVGGGYHGKSTLLCNALELGVYNHVAGDGAESMWSRMPYSSESCAPRTAALSTDVDISLFINDLPNKKDTRCFSTEDASGSTSQAAGIVEGIEAGSKVFLLDEDTSATNFMVRDTFYAGSDLRDKEAHHSVSGTAQEICATKPESLPFWLPEAPVPFSTLPTR
ncbi:MAG: P-loop domain-containing protein [Lachnospiraceae bacterium]